MAAEAFTSSGVTAGFNSAAAWNEDFGGGHNFPISGDTATMNSGVITLAEAAVCSGLVLAAGGTLVVAAGNSLDVEAGDFSFDGGTLTFNVDLNLTGDFDLGGGDIDTNGNSLVITDGAISTAAAALTLLEIQTKGASSIAWDEATNLIDSLHVSTGSLNLTGNVVTRAITSVAGTAITRAAAQTLTIRNFSNGTFVDIQGDCDVNLMSIFMLDGARSNAGRIHNVNGLTLRGVGTQLTQVGEVDIGGTAGTLSVFDFSAGGNVTTFDITASYSSIGNTKLGSTADDNNNGVINYHSGTLRITGTLEAGHVTGNLANALHLNSSFVEIANGAEIDGANITVTADDEAVHIVGIGTATLTDFEPDNVVHSHECVFAGATAAGNTDTTERYPYQSLLGVA